MEHHQNPFSELVRFFVSLPSDPFAQTGCCAMLLRAGANAAVRRHDGTTTLHFAAQHGHASLCQELLAAGAEPDPKAHDGATPLLLVPSTPPSSAAARNGEEELARLIRTGKASSVL